MAAEYILKISWQYYAKKTPCIKIRKYKIIKKNPMSYIVARDGKNSTILTRHINKLNSGIVLDSVGVITLNTVCLAQDAGKMLKILHIEAVKIMDKFLLNAEQLIEARQYITENNIIADSWTKFQEGL